MSSDSVHSAAHSPGLNGYINMSLNACGYVFDKVVPKAGSTIFPATLGYFGGWLTGVSKQKGLFQGLFSAVYHITVFNMQEEYIRKNEGKGPYDLNIDTVALIRLVGFVAGIAVPIFVTYQYGDTVINAVLEKGPSLGGWGEYFLTSVPTRKYSLITGVLVNITPTLAQHIISWARSEDPRKKNSLKNM